MSGRPSRHRALVTGGAALLLLVSLLTSCGVTEPPLFTRPPIVIVDVDTLRADHLGCYGYRRATSPSIDAFSRDSAFFQWAFAQAPNTPPSQGSILTGLYPTSHGRVGNERKIADGVVSLAEVLHAAGYATAAFVDGGLMVSGFGLEQGFELYDDAGGRLEAIAPKAERWLRNRVEGPSTRDQPFLLLVHTYDTHSPYEVTPEPFKSAFLEPLAEPPREFMKAPSEAMGGIWNARHEQPPPRLSDRELAWAVALYDGGILHVDAWFGEFVSLLKRLGIYDQAIVVFISDHGDEFQEHGGLFHERLYATVTRIPLMIRFPNGAFAGSFDQVVESIDLMPTLLEAVAEEVPAEVQGTSLMSLVRDGRHQPKLAVSESPYYGRRVAVTSARFRLLHMVRNGTSELYRYRNDPAEQRDLAADMTSRRAGLERRVRKWQRLVQANRPAPETGRDLSEQEKEQLRALGYLDS